MRPRPEGETSDAIVRFLLGDVSEEERQSTEQRMLSDDSFYQSLLAAEDDLIDEYVAGRLSERERTRFESFFLRSPGRHERVEFARALRRVVKETPAPMPTPARLRVSQRPSFAFAVLSALAVVLACGAWLMRENLHLGAQLSKAQAERAELKDRLSRTDAKTADTRPLAFVLRPGLERTGGSGNLVVLPPGTLVVELRLALPATRGYAGYRARLETAEGEEIWSQAVGAAAGPALILQLPSKILAAGDYVLAVKGALHGKPDETVASYSFRVLVR